MKTFSTITLLALPFGAFALQVTSPGLDAVWNSTGSHTITWSSVSTDPTQFGIFLTNFNVNPPQVLPLNNQVSTSAGSWTFDTALPVGDNYRIRLNAINTPQNSGILAESQQFSVVQGGPDPSVSVSVVDGTSTVVFGTPTGTSAKTTGSGTSKTGSVTETAATDSTATGEATGTAASTGTAGSGSTGSGATGTAATGTTKGTSTATGTSSGHATYGSRGFAIAVGMIGVGFAAMFVIA